MNKKQLKEAVKELDYNKFDLNIPAHRTIAESFSPWYNCCAEDINWKQRIKLQSAIQKYIDHAISSTINLPENVTEEEVGEIYLAAWKHRLKGITVYRNNCRSGVLIDKKDEKTNKRAKRLKCHIYHPSVKGKKYYAAIGLYENGKPYEIFVGNNGIEKEVTEGYIQRIRNGRYSLIADNEVIIEDMGANCSDEEEAVARLASISLRSGVNIHSVVDQLEKTKGSLSGFTKAMTRVLKKYIPDKTTSNEECPECKEKLVYQEGCVRCVKCSYSKC
jgi:ribonucleoside-diphosphate reductase alpha chain